MKKNMGSMDRIVRLIISLAFVLLYYTQTVSGTLGLVLVILAGIFTLTSILGWCPLYLPFGISTIKKKD